MFIRSGAKTHGAGMHEHPKFLAGWTKLLAERGAQCDGGNQFPTTEQLARTDVLLIYSADGGDLTEEQRVALKDFLARGGGLVTLLDGVCGHDPHWWKNIVGAAWEYNHTKWRYTKLTMRVRDHAHPVTTGVADFELDDEVYDGLHTVPEAHVLADAEFILKPADTNGTASTKTIPQMWVLEKNGYRAFTWIQGLRLKTFDVPQYQALLLRGIAWAGRRQDVNQFCTTAELSALQATGSNSASLILSPESPDSHLHNSNTADLTLLGTVTSIEIANTGNRLKNWVVTAKVDQVVSGDFSGGQFSFAVHSPAQSGLEVGKQYRIHAARAGTGYVVDEHQWLKRRAPEKFFVRFDTSKGNMVLEVHRDWSPHGADRFYNLVRGGYYDDSRFFRIRAGTWAQFGINGNPEVSKVWRDRNIPDDPRVLSNVRGTIAFAFAVPNGRSTQVFINLKDNAATHDSEPFVPFGKVVQGMEAADALNAEYGESSGGGIRGGKQGPLFESGNAYLNRDFPRLDFIWRATIIESPPLQTSSKTP